MTPPATAEQWRVRTEDARRQSRFVAAKQRVARILEAEPRLTAEQLAELAAQLTAGVAA